MWETSFRKNRELPALTDYFKKETFSYYETAKEIARLHMLFEECGLRRGDRVALIGRNNPRWVIAYIATMTYGAVIVPILQDFNPNDINHIINHSESKLLFLGDNYWDVIPEDGIEHVEAVFSLTDYHCIWERGSGERIARYQRSIIKHYRSRYPRGFHAEDIKYPDIPNDSVCIMSYTSGTTGFSKGVMLTVNNVTSNVAYCIWENVQGNRILSFLPLAHAYGCVLDMLVPLAIGSHVTLLGKIPSPKILVEALEEVRPQVICCVPLVLEKIVRKQVFPVLGKGWIKTALKMPLLDQQIYASIRKKLLAAFGGAITEFIVGGAPLNREIEEFLLKIKFPLTVGYGLTECSPLISYCHYQEFTPASCGKVLHRIMEARIDSPDPRNVPGEILVRGDNVMKGYYKNEKATREVLDEDGWLHTGDIGTMDSDLTLYIRGRSKSMILTANGQNIYPEEIEAKLNNFYCVMESLVLERDGRLVALVVPDYEQADQDNVPHSRLAEIMEDNRRELNSILASYEQVARIVLYPTEFEKTPKKSIRRYLYTI